ncbi:response regulator transcription factor [Novosphingobium pentaromativorans]|nr:response regulator transcription factor [Novosphingobium pentaromativorans]AIT81816.1 XRE family transcriptional regulator [Novosphingobium pentaromativorans US6-1]
MHVLLAEDDLKLAAMIAERLVAESHTVAHASSGPEALEMAEAAIPDVVVLDRMLPGIDGLSVLRRWREVGLGAPVLMLTALDSIDDRVEGLETGADDYLGKPFAFTELLARLNALMRRAAAVQPDLMLEARGVVLDLLKREARCGDQPVLLQPREFRLLEQLVRNKGDTVTRQMLLEKVWGFHFDPQTNIVETHMSRLRSKLVESGACDVIQTVRGVGYRIDET